ncbi:GNAT family N-acetyltransferase [Terracoccus sp. 273MFTsu3.1]|uniref:GNAT family N-acetyltransferase n=1 Tax=Terracoccus sp. 273MFTsu3.1 TaxID=1172188 RepID=UPI000361BF50|nr:GNAT family N-acetyltransferase [Terracoccus sp. 273MFTsu3.1]
MSHVVRPALSSDLDRLPGLEAEADSLFATQRIGPLPPAATTVDELARAAAVLVVGDPAVGFARIEHVDGQAHLEQLAVQPAEMRQGLGTALVESAAVWAARDGSEVMTLCTFADVPWNAPFYAGRGFVELTDLGPGLGALRETERHLGLDGLGRRIVMVRGVGTSAVLGDLAVGLASTLGGDLLGLYAHGSLVVGDFSPARSDLDVLAVVARPPDDAMLAAVAPVLAALEGRHPGWRGRIEVETVARSTVESYASGAPETSEAGPPDAIMRISPGEELHLLPATSHRVVTWSAVRRTGRRLVGPEASEVLPAVSAHAVRDALLDHVRDWPTWVESMKTIGAQAYSVLSICRAWCAVVEGEQLSKRAAADRFMAERPSDADLVEWARDWWYEGGSDGAEGRFAQVSAFVTRTSRAILGSTASDEQ